MVFHVFKNMILNLCISLQIITVVTSQTILLLPRLLIVCCFYLVRKLLLERFQESPNNNLRPEMEDYSRYVVQIGEKASLSNKIPRNALNKINRILNKSEQKELSSSFMKLLTKSTGFTGVAKFDDKRVPPLRPDEFHHCWSLVAVTLTAIAISIPSISGGEVKDLLSAMKEGLRIVNRIEESVYENNLVKETKASRSAWTDVQVYKRWLQMHLRENIGTSKEILQRLGDEAVQMVIKSSLDDSSDSFIAARSMYRISQTLLLHCSEEQEWPDDDQLFERILTIIADLFSAMLLCCSYF